MKLCKLLPILAAMAICLGFSSAFGHEVLTGSSFDQNDSAIDGYGTQNREQPCVSDSPCQPDCTPPRLCDPDLEPTDPGAGSYVPEEPTDPGAGSYVPEEPTDPTDPDYSPHLDSYTFGALLVLGFPLLIGAWNAALKFFFRVTAETASAAFVATLFCFALLLAFVGIHGYLRQAADDRKIPCACDEAPTQLLGEEHRADDETIQQ